MKLPSTAALAAALAAAQVSLSAPVNDFDKACTSAYSDLTGSSAAGIYRTNFWLNGELSSCFNFGAIQTPSTVSNLEVSNVVFPVYTNGLPAGRPIFQSSPCDVGSYSGLWNRIELVVDCDVPFDSVKSFERTDLDSARQSQGLYVYALVPKGTELIDDSAVTPPAEEGWFNGKKIWFFDFGRAPFEEDEEGNPSLKIDRLVEVTQFGESIGLPVVDAGPSRVYTGFLRRVISELPETDNYEADAIKSAGDLTDSALAPVANDTLVLCPVRVLSPVNNQQRVDESVPFLFAQDDVQRADFVRGAVENLWKLYRRLTRRDQPLLVHQKTFVLKKALQRLNNAVISYEAVADDIQKAYSACLTNTKLIYQLSLAEKSYFKYKQDAYNRLNAYWTDDLQGHVAAQAAKNATISFMKMRHIMQTLKFRSSCLDGV
ncbi:hypothetical protein DFJ73DRAFT_104508 [Zopfochytrium polystomum]|nr:hypothetical protein DFJ73DRAFT_104508 [Zopfochytrium polystomum]